MKTAIVLIAVLSISAIASSATIYVPDDYLTIQGAINASVNGDTIIVRPGIYLENIDFLGKAITVKSSDGAEATTIDGGSPLNPDFGSVVTFNKREEANSLLDGFTLTNGTGTKYNNVFCGGGIFCMGASPTVIHNIIFNNSASLQGGAIFCHNASPSVRDNTIKGNMAGWHGGGICCEWYSGPTIINNTFSRNLSTHHGGGIYCTDSYPVLTNNILIENIAGSYGGGIFSYSDSHPLIMNNHIFGNLASSGGGIGCYFSGALLINNTIHGNSADFGGGGIYCDSLSFMVINNSIFWDNSAPFGSEIWVGSYEDPSTIMISYSDLRGGKTSVYLDDLCYLDWGDGMIDEDPLFVDSTGADFHLTFQSPCRDSGISSSHLPDYDFEGDPRVAWGGTVDMGADEFYTHLYITGNKTPSVGIQGKFVGIPETSPVGLFIASGIRPSPAPTAYGDFWLLPPWILIPLVPILENGILAIPTTVPPTPPGPYDIPMQALIGLSSDSLSNLCVLEVR